MRAVWAPILPECQKRYVRDRPCGSVPARTVGAFEAQLGCCPRGWLGGVTCFVFECLFRLSLFVYCVAVFCFSQCLVSWVPPSAAFPPPLFSAALFISVFIFVCSTSCFNILLFFLLFANGLVGWLAYHVPLSHSSCLASMFVALHGQITSLAVHAWRRVSSVSSGL